MLLLSSSYKSRILPVVIAGFILMLIVISISWFFTSQFSHVLSSTLSESRLLAKKIDTVTQLIELTRSRTRLTQKLFTIDKNSERNEITLKINENANEFTLLTRELISTDLSNRESSILEEQAQYSSRAVELQRQVNQLVASGDKTHRVLAGTILTTKMYLNQDGIIDHLMKLLSALKTKLDMQIHQTQINVDQHRNTYLVMILFIVIGALSAVLLMVRTIFRVEKQLILDKEKAQVTLGSIGDGVISVNNDGVINYFNQLAVDIFSGSSELKKGGNILHFLDQKLIDENNQVEQFIKRTLQASTYSTGSGEFRVNPVNNPELVLNARILPILSAKQKFSGLVLSLHDISKSERLLDEIQFLASHDALTGLMNRRAFEDKVKKEISRFNSPDGHVLCVINLDQFKVINDSAGHTAGDEMLQQLASMMQSVFRQSDLFCRLGGDEFAVLLVDVNEHQAITIIQQLSQTIHGFGFSWEGNVYRVSASMGMVPVKTTVVDYNALLQAAEMACKTAKNEGRDQFHLLSIHTDLIARKAQESTRLKYLTWSIENEQNLVLYEQAIVPISKRTEGHKHVEVLLRMKGVNGKIHSPMSFIPIAERYSLMARIDRWVVQQVCQHILATPLDKTVYAVNLSGESLSSKEAMKELVTIIFESRIPAQRLCIEVTETVAIANLEVASRFMIVLQEYGCTIALDDFGSGLSSFSYLSTFPLDYLKIDGVFIQAMKKDKASQAMIEAINYIGRRMGLKTIAEYVEDEESVAMLKKMKVDFVQGYYYDKPHELITAKTDKPLAQSRDS